MRIIKRYTNRKLYDTKTHKYISLIDIVNFVRSDIDFIVIDNKTKQNITNQHMVRSLEKIGLSDNTIKSIIRSN